MKAHLLALICGLSFVCAGYAEDKAVQAGSTLSNPAHKACAEQFFDLPLFPNSRLCLTFADKLPASMSYYADATPSEVIAFYRQQLGENASISEVKGRHLLTDAKAHTTVIISEDQQGSQVDLLVKAQ